MSYDRAAYQRYYQRHRHEPEYKYRAHRANARARNILFLLTFDQWWELWKQSGKWKKRGWSYGQYVMARPGDQGAYEIGNVIICLAETNRAERNQNYSMKGEDNPAFGKDYWAAASKIERKRRSAKLSAISKGKPKSKQMCRKLSQTATNRRRVIRDGCVTWAYPGDFDYPEII